MTSSILAAVDTLNTCSPINTNQDLPCKPLHAAAPDWVNNLLQSRRTSGINEIITPSQSRITLNVSTEHVLKQSPLLEQRVASQINRANPDAVKVIRDRRVNVETEELVPQTKLQANQYAQIPTDIFEAERALSVFDCSSMWGPKPSVFRFERLARLRKYSPTAG
jgi:hypothetical protein